jgi:signal peptidase I
MAPSIQKGDGVIVTSVPNESLSVGDVVTFTADAGLSASTITHRIIETPDQSNGGMFITKGDANQVTDEPILPNRIVGKVTNQIPMIGSALDMATSPAGLIIGVYIPALIVVLSEFRLLTKHFQRTRIWRHVAYSGAQRKAAYKGFAIIALVGSFFVATPVLAGVFDQATLTGNTITSIDLTNPNPANCNSNQTSVSVNGGSGSGNTSISITNNSNQNAQSGSASNSNNTNGGSAASGNASNCNSANINIGITN